MREWLSGTLHPLAMGVIGVHGKPGLSDAAGGRRWRSAGPTPEPAAAYDASV